ncbi:energy transducer TonB [Flavobacterium sp.]|uniref:energy transducer TonB n=1 Tax=Flavobacterium sp. TaxID=239 RepID=UPI0035B47891
MFNVSIYEKNWTDLVFEGKNQQYGAYVLRRENERTTLISLFLGLLLFTSAILIFSFVNSLSKGDTVVTPDEIPNVIKVTNWTQAVEKKKDALPLVKKKSQETKHIDKKIINNPTIVKSTDNPDDVATNKEAKNITTDNTNTTGTGIISINNTGGNGGNTSGDIGIGDNPNKDVDVVNKTFELDKIPSYPHGMDEFYKYVAKNFKTPELDEGQVLTVLVSFIVEKDGSMSNIKVLRNPGYGMDKEAIRVLQSLKVKWEPGIIKGQKVRTEYALPIKVKVN